MKLSPANCNYSSKNGEEYRMLYFIEFLRAIAVALITNSHFKGVYPIDMLAFGGGLGVALFYIISGYLLANIKTDTKFSGWYIKKIIRLYIPLWIVKIIQLIFSDIKINSTGDFIREFIFTTGYWFTASLVAFYILYYVYMKYIYLKYGNKSFYIAFGILFIGYTLFYITKLPIGAYSLGNMEIHEFSVETPYIISQFIWFGCMLLGAFLRKRPSEEPAVKKKWLYLILAGFSVFLFFLIRVLENKTFDFLEYFLAVPYFGFAYYIFKCFALMENTFINIKENILGKFILLISSTTLEIYYVQQFLISIFAEYVFPLNFVLLVVSIVLLGVGLHFISKFIIKKAEEILK